MLNLINKKPYISLIPVVLFALIFFSPDSSVAVKKGIASWYGGGEKLNKHTANAEVFDPKAFTCASWSYPFNTRLKVTNLQNGKSVIVRVNDRGPNKRLKREIDLTKNAFQKIANTKKGLILVKIERLS